jgi:Fic family protein
MLRASVNAVAAHKPGAHECVTANLSTAILRYIHRMKLPADPFGGKYRQTQIWLVDPTGTLNTDLECPSWDKVPALMEQLVTDWNRAYCDLVGAAEQPRIAALARFFHGLLTIHPFIDGNGRFAREVLSLQARELFGLDEDLLLDRGPPYYRALRLADSGVFGELEQLIRRARDLLE